MILQYFNLSKQAVSQYKKRLFVRESTHKELLLQAQAQRLIHPRMGAKVLYSHLRPQSIGRVAYEKLLMKHGFRLRPLRNFIRTTDSQWVPYKNLIAGLTLRDINQVWVSDITYYFIANEVFYITSIMDLYSRRILGYSASRTMQAEESSMKCLHMAFKTRGLSRYNSLIHHSDRGSQYRYKAYCKALSNRGIKISMCSSVYDNPHMERMNGTLKNDYLIPMGVDSFEQLQKKLAQTVRRYNELRPHSSLNRMSPIQYEQFIESITSKNRPKTIIQTEISTIHSN